MPPNLQLKALEDPRIAAAVKYRHQMGWAMSDGTRQGGQGSVEDVNLLANVMLMQAVNELVEQVKRLNEHLGKMHGSQEDK